MERVQRRAAGLGAALAFLTRFPVPAGAAAGDFAAAVRWFPLVGAWVGCLCAATYGYGAQVLPLPVAAGLAVVAGLLATGALHEDGLADTADGLGGGRDRARALEIMRDSRIGSFGALALVSSVGLRWAALAQLSPGEGALALIAAHGVSRGLLAPVPLLAAYARPQGLGGAMGGVRPADALAALAVTVALPVALAGWSGLAALAVSALAAAAVLALLVRRLGGYTGDGLGAIQQVAEIAMLVSFAGLWA